MLAAVSSVVKGIPRDGTSDEVLVESNCSVCVVGCGGVGWGKGVCEVCGVLWHDIKTWLSHTTSHEYQDAYNYRGFRMLYSTTHRSHSSKTL